MAQELSSALGEAKRRAVAEHVLVAARRHVLTNGLNVTMDDLAIATGVSRRTLFRHFSSRERLLAAAFDAGMLHYREHLPAYDGDVQAWLRRTCDDVHRMNATIGPGFFDLTSRSDLAPELLAVEQRRRREFRDAMTQTAQTLWTAVGRSGRPSREISDTICAHLSPHFTAALIVDTGKTHSLAADLAFTAITDAVERELR